jgi:phage baseplate assembly protein W
MPKFAQATTDYGTDVTTFVSGLGLDPYFTEISGPRVVVEALARNLLTPTGSYDDQPDIGTDLRDLINAHMSDGAIASVQRLVEAEATKDERIAECSCTATLSEIGELIVSVSATLILGETFRLVLSIDQVTKDYTVLKATN